MTTAHSDQPSAGNMGTLRPDKSMVDEITRAKRARQDGLVIRADLPIAFNYHKIPKLQPRASTQDRRSN